jgi:CDP-glucose 4,6-dehydratase
MTPRTSSHWTDRPVFVTGATGLLGGWLVRQLVEQGADVTALVRDWVPKSLLLSDSLLGRVSVVRGDVRDQRVL